MSEATAPGDIAGLILAAGASSRMGTPKALLSIGTETFLDRLLRVFSASLRPVIVVLGHQAEDVRSALMADPLPTFVVNPDPERGMLSSLQCGLAALGPSVPGVLFTPVDYPNYRPDTVALIAETFRSRACDVVIPVHAGAHGHPVCISARVIREILELPVTAQAPDAIHRYRDRTIFLAVNDPGVAKDIDTPEDYRQFVRAV